MKKLVVLVSLVLMIVSLTVMAEAVDLYVDSAPNVYGSPDWAGWWAQTKADVAAGSMTNLRTGTYPGTNMIDPYDEIVYSTGDAGKRLHWIYWLPGESVSALSGLFEVKWEIDWGGTSYTQVGTSWSTDPNAGWSQPQSWEDYNGGVIGSLGFAWWATDNEAAPLDTGGSAYDETNQADIDALRADVFAAQTYAKGMVRYRSSVNDAWQTSSLQVNVAPEPISSTLFLVGAATLGFRRFRKNRK